MILAEYIREMFEHEKYRVLCATSSSDTFDSFAGSLGLRGLKRKLFARAMAGEYPHTIKQMQALADILDVSLIDIVQMAYCPDAEVDGPRECVVEELTKPLPEKNDIYDAVDELISI
ncbi:MAG: hypothetical protein PHT33_10960, partial [bacterium]|nr:hypothetical protein [bacterium]